MYLLLIWKHIHALVGRRSRCSDTLFKIENLEYLLEGAWTRTDGNNYEKKENFWPQKRWNTRQTVSSQNMCGATGSNNENIVCWAICHRRVRGRGKFMCVVRYFTGCAVHGAVSCWSMTVSSAYSEDIDRTTREICIICIGPIYYVSLLYRYQYTALLVNNEYLTWESFHLTGDQNGDFDAMLSWF